MKLKARLLEIQAGTGRRIVLLDDETSSLLGVHSSDRLQITYHEKCVIAIVNIASNFPRNCLGLYEEVSRELGVQPGELVGVQPAERPESLSYVLAKIRGERLRESDIDMIVTDVLERHLSDIELASFVTAIQVHGLSIDESEALCRAMVNSGSTLDLGKDVILDKHSIGGIPGDKTSILVVPIIAAAGYIIPKTSSRAVTSPAGTADRFEALCPVDLPLPQIKEVVNKTNGCIVWGGALDLAPADDIFIQIEYPLSIDPLLLPSIMSKKTAIGASHLVIDIPTGRGAKMKTTGEAHALAYEFMDLGKRLGINVQCAVTFGEQPPGYAIGPTLEAREALSTLMGKGPADLTEKATSLAGILFEMVGHKNGKRKARRLLESGKAERKLREIIAAQGGNPDITPEEMSVGDKTTVITAPKGGSICWVKNRYIAQVAREAGAPKEHGAGVLLKAKLGDRVQKGDVLFEIYSERSNKLKTATNYAKRLQPIGISGKPEETMMMDRIPTRTIHRKSETLER